MYSDTIPQNGDLQHANYGIDNSFVIQQVTTPWDPAQVTWFNQPATTTENQIVIPSTSQPFENLEIDVRTLIQKIVNTNANYGFMLRLQNETKYTSRIFCSSYYFNTSRHPRLVLLYQGGTPTYLLP